MDKTFIPNRHGLKMPVLVERGGDKGLVFIMHGLGGFKEQEHIAAYARAFLDCGFTAVRFDTTHSVGEGDGAFENATITAAYDDLEDVLSWAATQGWYQEPFTLVGNSMGGICVALYAQKHPQRVCALAPIVTVVSGALSVEAHKMHEPDRFADWERTGWREEISGSKPGVVKRLPWSHVEDRLKYDLIPQASRLTMPVLMIVGENDTSCPPAHQRLLYDALPGPKEWHVIKGAPHSLRDPSHLAQLREIFLEWIGKI